MTSRFAMALAGILTVCVSAGCTNEHAVPDVAQTVVGVETDYGTVRVGQAERIAVLSENDLDIVTALGITPVVASQDFSQAMARPWFGTVKNIPYVSGGKTEIVGKIGAYIPDVVVATDSWLSAEYVSAFQTLGPIVAASASTHAGSKWVVHTLQVGQATFRSQRARSEIAKTRLAFTAAAARIQQNVDTTGKPVVVVLDSGAFSSTNTRAYKGPAVFEVLHPHTGIVDMLQQALPVGAIANDKVLAQGTSVVVEDLDQLQQYSLIIVGREGTEVQQAACTMLGDDALAAVRHQNVLSLRWLAHQIQCRQ